LAIESLWVLVGRIGVFGNEARFPQMVVHVVAEEFDFFGVGGGGGGDLFCPGIVEEAEGEGDGVALLFVTLEKELHVVLAQTLIGQPDAGVVLFHFLKDGSGGGAFDEIVGIGVFGVGSFEEFEDFAGGNGGGGGSELAIGGIGHFDGVTAKLVGGGNTLLLPEPATVAVLAPEGEVGGINFGAVELGGEDFFDGGKAVEPGEDFRTALAVVEALVELLADVVRQTGDFAGEGAVGVVGGGGCGV